MTFNAIAAPYDTTFTNSATGRLQRDVVWRVLEACVPGGSGLRVLELSGGTGEDALWFARRGARVLLTDAADGMLAVARQKAVAAGIALETRVLRFEDLDAVPETGFDLIFTNFGGLNCVSPEDLHAFARAAAHKLRPGGLLCAVVMGRFCWWETVYFLAKGRFREAFRRLRKGPLAVPLDATTHINTWYYGAASFHTFFPGFKRLRLCAVGCWLPPSYLDPFFKKRPGLLRFLNGLEKRFRSPFWASGADHFLVVVEKG